MTSLKELPSDSSPWSKVKESKMTTTQQPGNLCKTEIKYQCEKVMTAPSHLLISSIYQYRYLWSY